MNCEQTIDRFLSSLTGDLEAEAAAALESHLATCAACRESTATLRAMWTNLEQLPREQPSEAVRVRFYAMLEAWRHQEQARHGLHLRESLNLWLERWWPRQPVFQFGLALLFLGAGLVLGPRLRSMQGEMQQLRAEIQTTRTLVALSMLQQQSPSQRLQGVSYSYQLQQPDPDVLAALLETLDTDSNVNVRLAAADALGQFREQPAVRQGLVESFRRQASPLVQIAIIDLLVDMGEPGIVDPLQRAAQDPKLNESVRQRARWGLQQLL